MFDEKYLDNLKEKIFIEGHELKKNGSKVVGVYCAFTPKEIIAAAGAIPVSLCASSQEAAVTAEKHLPKNLCPLIKASYGHALQDDCPYFSLSDFLLADATCDGKKKMFELLNNIKPLHMLHLPQTSETKESVEYWLNELYKIKDLIEDKTGNKITEEALRAQVKLYNDFRKVVNELYSLNKGEVPLLCGKEIDNIVNGIRFECNLQNRIEEIKEVINKIKDRVNDEAFLKQNRSKPRILLTGCPTTNKKVLNTIEENGGIVVTAENCGGLKTTGLLVDEEIEPMRALAERYLSIACPCMTPNTKRLDLIQSLIDDYKIDGVVELTWQGCHTYNVEAYGVKKFVTEKCNKPYIQIETDYTENDSQQIKVRIEAFLEMLG